MTNEEAWNFYMKESPSPQDFIDAGFYFMISAALQRRVWLGNGDMCMFPNIYVVLVGEPGIGKGLTITQVTAILRSLKKVKQRNESFENEEEIDITDTLSVEAKKARTSFDDLLLPTAADCATFEALVQENAKRMSCYRNAIPGTLSPSKLYFHCSIYLALEEMGTLFRKNVENLIMYLIKAFDCGDFRYDTKTKGKDIVKNCCLSIMAGTTPAFVHRAMDDSIINEGFSARTLFIYAPRNRFNRFEFNKFTPEQLEARAQLAAHIQKLASLFGPISFTPDAKEFLRHYVEEVLPYRRANNAAELKSYYGRKSAHLQKLAVLELFKEQTTSMTLEKHHCEKALAYLERIEKGMHLALMMRKGNPIAEISERVIIQVEQTPGITFVKLLQALWDHTDHDKLMKAVNFLKQTEQIREEDKRYYGKSR